MGKQYIAVFAEYDGGEPEPEQRRKFSDMPRSAQAGMLCQDESFIQWIGAHDPNNAAERVRAHCMVASRAELDTDKTGADRAWDTMVAKYREQMGLRI